MNGRICFARFARHTFYLPLVISPDDFDNNKKSERERNLKLMAEICNSFSCGETSTDPRIARRRRMEFRRIRLLAGVDTMSPTRASRQKRLRSSESPDNVLSDGRESGLSSDFDSDCGGGKRLCEIKDNCLSFGVTSVCGRRREMEDSVSVHLDFVKSYNFFGVFDGHGCSHVATLCKQRMHEIIFSELKQRMRSNNTLPRNQWREAMSGGFAQMDKEAMASGINTNNNGDKEPCDTINCSCGMRAPRCHHVGSTAVVAVVGPTNVIVASCGDSRAVLCRNGLAIPLSSDHKPDRPDELQRIQKAGGRVIYWDGARVFGVLAMSRAIGDSYLKPFVISEPEVIVTERNEQDECLILASDGLWDVVSNEAACDIVSRCLKRVSNGEEEEEEKKKMEIDRACEDAALILTKLALARGSSDNVSVVVINLKNGNS